MDKTGAVRRCESEEEVRLWSPRAVPPAPRAALSSLRSSTDEIREVWSTDFLDFSFNQRSYAWQLENARANTPMSAAVACAIRQIDGMDVMWMAHEFRFIGGSLGCAEGEMLCRGFEKAAEFGIPVVLVARSGGARMQEGTLALMQMAKVSAAVNKYRAEGLPYISVCCDPTFGGTTASYAMQGDIRIALRNARIGFAGESVILNTVYKMDQAAYDRDCPPGFQTAPFVLQHGQVDMVVEDEAELDRTVAAVLRIIGPDALRRRVRVSPSPTLVENDRPADYVPDYTKARKPDRVQTQDIVAKLFAAYVELSGDGRVGYDRCIRGGLALLDSTPCVVVATYKGHDPASLTEANYGMAEPAGYRTACRLFRLAEHFGIPVITLVDTPGAFPSFSSEITGQPEAIATNLLTMAGLRVPIVTLLVGEGGSGGALALAVGDAIGMLSDGYYGVITPEGAASILCRYRSEEEKARLFLRDCRAIAKAQHIYAEDLKKLGVIDEIIWEQPHESCTSCDHTIAVIRHFVLNSLADLCSMAPSDLVAARHKKFRRMGKFDGGPPTTPTPPPPTPSSAQRRMMGADGALSSSSSSIAPEIDGILHLLADTSVNGSTSVLWNAVPPTVSVVTPIAVSAEDLRLRDADVDVEHKRQHSAKWILDHEGADAVRDWMKRQKRLLITDTTMRDAHQSLLATRVRTADLLAVAEETAVRLRDAFSLEMWGGATFDVCIRFLHEDPWRRLRLLRRAIPNVCFQMLLRGSNAVGYKSYPDNVIVQFIRLAARNGIDVFRIFDCFNDVSQMQLSIDTVRACGKLAEVCICFTGNFLSPDEKIYTLDYYKDLARRVADSGAHIIGIKDMAGLFRPQMVQPFMAALRSVTDLPVHFHTHNTSGAGLATLLELSRCGVAAVDVASASMSDTTSQPSMNALITALEGTERDTGIDWMALERLDTTWAAIRAQYFANESGLKAGSARVYHHQMPGGQYSNLFAQSKSIGLYSKWSEVLDMYHDVNQLFGDIVKVTPSSKCVGDMALFLLNKGLTTQDVLDHGDTLDFPQSVVGLFRGDIGFPHHGLPQRLTDIILHGDKPFVGRPGDHLPPADFAAIHAELQAHFPERTITEEDVVGTLLYPAQYTEFLDYITKNGESLVMGLPTYHFLFGMRIGASFEISVPPLDSNNENDSDSDSSNHLSPRLASQLPVTVTLQRVGPLSNENYRTVVFRLVFANGQSRRYEVKIAETRKEDLAASVRSTLANPADPSQIPSPLPGVVDKTYITVGQHVKKGDVLMSVAAMKMEVEVVAPFDGVVERMCVQVGTKVDNKTLLAQIKEC